MTKLGPTGRRQRPSLNDEDEGELAVGLAADDKGNVVINFGTPIEWIGLPAPMARQFADLLKAKADEAEEKIGRKGDA